MRFPTSTGSRVSFGRASRLILLGSVLLAIAACSPEDGAPPETASQGDADVMTEDTGSNPPQPIVAIETQPEVRQVLPGRAIHVPQAGAELERLAAPVVVPPPPRPVNLGIVLVEEANRFSTRRGVVVLKGTEAISRDAQCQLEDGRAPACHVLARTAVRRFVARRSVSCTLTLREDSRQDHNAPCFLGNTDLGLWVVAQGWAYATAEASADQRAAETTARAEQRGLWALTTSRVTD